MSLPQMPKTVLVAPPSLKLNQKGKRRKKQTRRFRFTNSSSKSKTSKGNWMAGFVRWKSRETKHDGSLEEWEPCRKTNWELGKSNKDDIIRSYQKDLKNSRLNCTSEGQWCNKINTMMVLATTIFTLIIKWIIDLKCKYMQDFFKFIVCWCFW